MTTEQVAAQDNFGLVDLSRLKGLGLMRVAVRATPVLVRGWPWTLALALIAGAARIIAPLTVQYAIDAGLSRDEVVNALVIGGTATLVASVSTWGLIRRVWFSVESAIALLRRNGLIRIHNMSASAASRVPSGDLVSRLTSDLDAMTMFLQGGGIQFVAQTAQLVIAGAVLLAYSWQLAVPVYLAALLLVLVMTYVQRLLRKHFRLVRSRVALMHRAISDAVLGAPVIRATGSQDWMEDRLHRAVEDTRAAYIKAHRPMQINTTYAELAISAMTVGVLFGGTWLAVRGARSGALTLTEGQIVAMLFLITFFVRPMQLMVQSLGEAQNALGGWRRALEIVVTPRGDEGRATLLPPGPISIDVQRMSAAYEPDRPVLKCLNVSIPAGQSVAVVGETGSGKSTFAKLLSRQIEPYDGRILLSGIPLANISDDSMASRVVVMPQDAFLFSGTIRDNISMGRPSATEAELHSVLRDIGIADWLAGYPQGLDTSIGISGGRLSVGERQLVALARTALVDPDLLVMDEATSNVDPATDVAVQHALSVIAQGRTVITIAHRMSTAEAADRILVFDAGRMVEDGKHEELEERLGRYAQLLAAWRDRT